MPSKLLLSLLSYGSLLVAASSLSLDTTGPESVDGVGNLTVTIHLTNTGSETLKLVNHPDTILSQLPTDAFVISHLESQAVPSFTGIKAKYSIEGVVSRGLDRSFTILEPGKTFQVERDLSKMYNFTSSGTGKYIISARSSFYTLDESDDLSVINADAKIFSTQLTGTKLSVSHEPEKITKRATFSGCSSSQESILGFVAESGQSYASKGLQAISAMTGSTTLYETWFGDYTSFRYDTVKSHYESISSQNFSDWHYDCSTCKEEDTYCFVFPDDPGRIFICDLFWDLQIAGQDSQGGALVHEASHFVGTEDYVNGRKAAKKLAKDNPAQATVNADNHEYFAEDA